MAENHYYNQGFIQSLVELIQSNIRNEHFGAKELAEAAGMSQRKLNLKLRTIKKKSVSCFIREIRLQKAFEMLQTEDVNASEAAYKVGFGSATYFNKCFHEYYGFPPGKIRREDFDNSEKSNLVKKISDYLSGKSFLKKVTYAFGGLIVIAGLLLIVNYDIFNNTSANNSTIISKNPEKSPTGDLSAYYYYLKGNQELLQSQYPDYKPEHVKRAEAFFRKVLEHDSTFAEAYLGLAYTYWQKFDRDLTISDNNILINYLDSMLILSDIALSYNPNLSMSYCIRAAYYFSHGDKKEKALEENNKAFAYNRNDWFANYQRGDIYSNINLVKAIEIASGMKPGSR